MGISTCGKCGGRLKPGIAMGQTVYCGDEGTMSPAGPGFVIDCLKCEACGWSVTATPAPAEPVMLEIVLRADSCREHIRALWPIRHRRIEHREAIRSFAAQARHATGEKT